MAEYGGNQALTDWNNFHNYVMANDMTDPAIWDNVTSQLDVNSLADYIIVNSVTVCSDWLNYNTGWWRGLDSSGTHKKWAIYCGIMMQLLGSMSITPAFRIQAHMLLFVRRAGSR